LLAPSADAGSVRIMSWSKYAEFLAFAVLLGFSARLAAERA
jgi:hypothetical protein